MSTQFNRAKGKAVSALANLINELNRSVSASKELEGLYGLALEEIERLSSDEEGPGKAN